MKKLSSSFDARVRRTRGSRVGQEPRSELEALGRRFELFRQEHPRGARVPDALRAATLAVLDLGVAPGELRRTCGVSQGQIMTWRAHGRPGPRKTRSAEPGDVRVFSVVDEPAGPGPVVLAVDDELELRLGAWCIRVRPGSAPAGRG